MAGNPPKLLYRQLLVAIDRNLTRVAGNKQWRNYVAAVFRSNSGLTDPVRIQQELQLALDYQELITNIAQHQVCACTEHAGQLSTLFM